MTCARSVPVEAGARRAKACAQTRGDRRTAESINMYVMLVYVPVYKCGSMYMCMCRNRLGARCSPPT
jgi:hypothetical protein